MPIERLVGINVVDENKYQKYRDNMLPILESYGGEFKYDFKVSSVLKNEQNNPINRIFILKFDSEDSLDSFFSDESYLEIRQKYFDSSVSSTTIISKYLT